MMRLITLTAVGILVASSAHAKTVEFVVNAKSGPWSVKANPNMPYGVGDEGEPTVVMGIEPDSGKVEIYPSGMITVGKKTLPSQGDESREVDDKDGKKKKRFPSFYAPKILYPAYAHGLVVTFVDDDGKVIGRPIMVGEGIRLPIPELATGLAFGVNDDSFAENSGDFSIKLILPDD
jgi:hypothetical protein